jgi:hypothetical protein
VRIVGALLMLALLYGKSPSVPLLLALTLVDLGAGVAISHAAARIDDRALLIGITALHHAGAAVWIGGLPCFCRPWGGCRRVRCAAGSARAIPSCPCCQSPPSPSPASACWCTMSAASMRCTAPRTA